MVRSKRIDQRSTFMPTLQLLFCLSMSSEWPQQRHSLYAFRNQLVEQMIEGFGMGDSLDSIHRSVECHCKPRRNLDQHDTPSLR